MIKQIDLDATTREETTPNALRREGRLPGVVYSRSMSPVALAVQMRAFDRVIQQGGRSRVINLNVEGVGKFPVIVKDLQYNPRKGTVMHVDFHRISLTEKLQTTVPIMLTGEEEVQSRGGVIQHQLRQMDIECLPVDIPSWVTVDVSELDIGDHISVGDVEFPEDVTSTLDAETVVLSIVAPRLVEETETETDEAEAEEALEGAEEQAEDEE